MRNDFWNGVNVLITGITGFVGGNIAKKLVELGFDLLGTKGTSNFLKKNNIPINKINKISEGSPHIVDLLESNKINLVINTTEGKASAGDSYVMRRNILLTNTPYYTTIKGADAAINSIEMLKKTKFPKFLNFP